MKMTLLACLFLLTGCYPGINGKVVDATTGKPLEGAIVLAQWTITHGLPGQSHSEPYEIKETETDTDGKFHMSGVYYPFVDQPELVIYKKGYLPWRNDSDFKDPNWVKYKKNVWTDNMTYRLDIFTDDYSYTRLDGFVGGGIIGSSVGKTPKFSEINSELFRKSQAEIDEKKSLIEKKPKRSAADTR